MSSSVSLEAMFVSRLFADGKFAEQQSCVIKLLKICCVSDMGLRTVNYTAESYRNYTLRNAMHVNGTVCKQWINTADLHLICSSTRQISYCVNALVAGRSHYAQHFTDHIAQLHCVDVCRFLTRHCTYYQQLELNS